MKVEAEYGTEVGDLTECFNTMVDSVQQDRKIIERPNEHQNHQSAELSRGVQELKQAESRISRDKELLRQEADGAHESRDNLLKKVTVRYVSL